MNIRHTPAENVCHRCNGPVPAYQLVGLVYDKQTHTWHDDTQLSADNRQRRHFWFDQTCANKVMAAQPRAKL